MKDKPIGIFDSGVGGITVLNELEKILPNEDYIYFGDSAHNPYGEKTDAEIELYSKTISRFLASKGVKIIVVACNTASIASLEDLREYIEDKYFVGVIDAGLEYALKKTNTKKIAVCCTRFTSEHNAYNRSLERLHPDTKNEYQVIHIKDEDNLANKIETNWDGDYDQIAQKMVNKIPKDFDTLVLGCTHYPLIRENYEKIFHGQIIDPAIQIAKDVKTYLEENHLINDREEQGKVVYYTSAEIKDFITAAKKIRDIKQNTVYSAKF